jgi:hypothetical protein
LKKPLKTTIQDYEKPIKELIGKTISKVNYYEIDYDGKPYWDEIEFHSLDYGVEMIMTDNSSYYFIWGNEVTQYDVKFRKGSILNEFGRDYNPNKYTVESHPKWKELTGIGITSIESFWTHWNFTNTNTLHFYPQDVKILFENGKEIWISALEIRENSIFGMQDHITIIFDQKTADKYKIGIKHEL